MFVHVHPKCEDFLGTGVVFSQQFSEDAAGVSSRVFEAALAFSLSGSESELGIGNGCRGLVGVRRRSSRSTFFCV